MALTFLLLACLFGMSYGDDICPPASSISPCTCDGEGFNCMGPRSIDDIRRALRANFKYGGVRSVWISGTKITSVPGDLFGNVRSQQFNLEMNDITTVDLKAFRASNRTMNSLSLFGNKIESLTFSDLSMYPALGTLNLGRNMIQTIPNNAFSVPGLMTLILAQNQISTIGMNAFNDLPSLTRLELSVNQLTTLGAMSMNFKSLNPGLQVSLAANQISDISPVAFNGNMPIGVMLSQNKLTHLDQNTFGNLIINVANKGGFIEVSGNPFDCNGCRYSWLVAGKETYGRHFVGFSCTDGRSMMQLTKLNIGC